MLKLDKTWLTVRADANAIKATMHASTIDDLGNTASESFEVVLDQDIITTVNKVLLDNTNEAAQRALEVGFTLARGNRVVNLRLDGAVGSNGGSNANPS